MKINLSLCMNDQNGNPTQECPQIDIEIDGDIAMQIEGDFSILEIPDNLIQIENAVYPYRNRATMVGNVFWNAYRVNVEDVVLLLNRLKDKDYANLLEGWQRLWDVWHGAEAFAKEDFLDWAH